jgi:hypothetical protein
VYGKRTRRPPYHPKKNARLSCSYGISDNLESLMRVYDLHNGHGTQQEEHDFAHFTTRIRQLL